MKMMTRYW